jgi:hypothetical protein
MKTKYRKINSYTDVSEMTIQEYAKQLEYRHGDMTARVEFILKWTELKKKLQNGTRTERTQEV